MSYDSTTSQDDDHDDSEHLSNTSNSICLCPNFTNYLYFLFAPTLVYCDTYPRTNRIKWRYVFTNFCQVFGSIMYTYYIFARFCIPVFQHFNTEHVTLKMFIHSILNCTLPGTLLLLVAFFAFLHSWLNAFAEMLRFGDRMFYQDWWNSTNFSNYYRTVHN
jgi:sterol O-acyltransferase